MIPPDNATAPAGAWATFRCAVSVDVRGERDGRAKYLDESTPRSLLQIATMIGPQMVFAIRVMQFFRDAGLGFAARIASRLIRHLYGAEIHWDAEVSPGLSIIHGNGLVISHAAKVGPGCVLAHNVTLGMGRDAETGASGAPRLERNVHIGPGATLLGPITVGEGTKLMAGAVLTQSVPPYSLVKPAGVEIVARKPAASVDEHPDR